MHSPRRQFPLFTQRSASLSTRSSTVRTGTQYSGGPMKYTGSVICTGRYGADGAVFPQGTELNTGQV